MTLEPIDTAGFKPAELRDQPQPMLIWAKVADLVIDRRYQRALTARGRSAIQRIANAWDWTKYQPILVAPSEGGTMAVVDGQHRAHAAALVGIEALPAMTVPMTLQEQAAGFAAVNRDRVSMTLNQIYRAELAAGAAWAIAARDAVAAAGCHLATSNPTAAEKKPGVVYGVGLIRRMIDNGEGDVVTAGLRAIRDSEQRDELEAYQSLYLKPWFLAIARSQRFLRLPLHEVFDEMDISSMFDDARARARQTGANAVGIVTDEIEARLRQSMEREAA